MVSMEITDQVRDRFQLKFPLICRPIPMVLHVLAHLLQIIYMKLLIHHRYKVSASLLSWKMVYCNLKHIWFIVGGLKHELINGQTFYVVWISKWILSQIWLWKNQSSNEFYFAVDLLTYLGQFWCDIIIVHSLMCENWICNYFQLNIRF